MAPSFRRPPALILTPGPVSAYPEVLLAMARPVAYDESLVFQDFYQDVARRAAKAMHSAWPPVILQVEPVVALEAAAASLIAPDDGVLLLVSGIYGDGFGIWAHRHARRVVRLAVPFDRVIDPDAVAAMLDAHPDLSVVVLCHLDTPSGTINPVDDIGAVCRARDRLLIVDAVSSWAGMDVRPETCGADIFVTGPAKCLGATPGLSLVHVSDRAWTHIEGNAAAPRASVLSLLDWRDAWRSGTRFPFTPSVAAIRGLAAALDLYLAEGPERVWARHALTAAACRAGLKAMGLALWPADEECAAPTVTVVRLPEALSSAIVLANVEDIMNVTLSDGRGALAGRTVRIGHMGPAAEPVFAVSAVSALGAGLRAAGAAPRIGDGVEAALAVLAAAGKAGL